MKVRIRDLGTYTVAVDTVPPEIIPDVYKRQVDTFTVHYGDAGILGFVDVVDVDGFVHQPVSYTHLGRTGNRLSAGMRNACRQCLRALGRLTVDINDFAYSEKSF